MLFSALYTSGTGVQAASSYLNLTGNNIANATTTGYKTVEPTFQDLVYGGMAPGGYVAPGQLVPGGSQTGTGAAMTATTGIFTQGTITPTGRPYDLAISGNGFFQVSLPGGTTGYTRDGSFTPNANGQLVNAEGYALVPPITVPPGTTSVSIGTDGTVTAVSATGTQTLGQVTVTNFINPAGLVRVGDNLYTAGPDAGTGVTGTPGTDGLGTISQNSLESSNVSYVNELVNLIVAQGTFLYNSQAILTENETIDDTVTELFPA